MGPEKNLIRNTNLYSSLRQNSSLDDTLKIVTKIIAKSMGLTDKRGKLLSLMKILDFSEHKVPVKFLIDKDNHPWLIGNSITTLNEERNIFQAFCKSHPDWSLYFPIREQEKEVGQESKVNSLFVTYSPPFVDDNSVRYLTGYTVGGREVKIDAQVPPKNPVLVLTYEPPLSNHFQKKHKNLYKHQMNKVVHNWGLFVKGINVHVSCEPWWLGALEIYTIVDTLYTWEDDRAKLTHGVRSDEYLLPYCQENWFAFVDRKNRWYYIDGKFGFGNMPFGAPVYSFISSSVDPFRWGRWKIACVKETNHYNADDYL